MHVRRDAAPLATPGPLVLGITLRSGCPGTDRFLDRFGNNARSLRSIGPSGLGSDLWHSARLFALCHAGRHADRAWRGDPTRGRSGHRTSRLAPGRLSVRRALARPRASSRRGLPAGTFRRLTRWRGNAAVAHGSSRWLPYLFGAATAFLPPRLRGSSRPVSCRWRSWR